MSTLISSCYNNPNFTNNFRRMKKLFFKLLLPPIFLLAGFFVFTNQAAAFDSTLPVECNYVYNPLDNLTENEIFWYDGEHFRFSFTSTKTFCTGWKWQYYSPNSINLILYPLSIEGQTRTDEPTFSFINDINDLNGMAPGESRFFKWERGKSYDTYLSSDFVSSRGYFYTKNFFDYLISIGWTAEDFSQNVKIFTFNFDNRFYKRRNLKEFTIDFSYLPAVKRIDPVILIPGMLGSWYNIFSNRWELDPIFHTYDNLWEAFKAAGYKEGETLFAFPYQWRNSNASSSVELKNKIDEVKDICQCGKVDIVAHSMGGLVARSYAEGNDYGNDIDQLIFLATPQRGASKAYLMWEGGETGPDYKDQILKRLFSLEAEFSGYGSVYLYISKLPMKSVQELLPTYDYLRDKSTMALRVYPNNYPRNIFLEDLNNPVKLSKLNGFKITNIIADAGASSTINNFRVVENKGIDGEWEHGYPEHYAMPFTDHGLEYGLGDETVPDRSNKDFNGWPNIIINANHDNVATDAQKIVIKELTGTEPVNEIKNNIFKKFLMIRIFSPADFRITAPDGKLLGKDFATNQPVNQIAGAFYSGFDNGIEFAVIPDPIEGDYKVDLMGTGNGEYKLSTSYIDDNNSLDKEFTGNIEPNQQRTLDFVLAPNTNKPISDLITIDGIIKEIEIMYAKGWINNMGAKMSLINGLKLIDLKSGKSNSAVIEKLKMVLNKLEQIRKQGKINQEGFQILKDDINNLKINL